MTNPNKLDPHSVEHRDLESRIVDLCGAVKVLSSVLADQLSHPRGRSEVSDYGLEVQPFMVDANMVRYAADHAAGLALEVRNRLRAR